MKYLSYVCVYIEDGLTSGKRFMHAFIKWIWKYVFFSGQKYHCTFDVYAKRKKVTFFIQKIIKKKKFNFSAEETIFQMEPPNHFSEY